MDSQKSTKLSLHCRVEKVSYVLCGHRWLILCYYECTVRGLQTPPESKGGTWLPVSVTVTRAGNAVYIHEHCDNIAVRLVLETFLIALVVFM